MINHYAPEDLLFKIALAEGRYNNPLSLTRHYAQVYSQNGEDGIVAEMLRRIGTGNRFFVEIGVENGLQNNTRFLLEQGWKGLWIDCNEELLDRARAIFCRHIAAGQLQILREFVTPDNVDDLLSQAAVPSPIDFLSLDTDLNTSHIWRAINRPCRSLCIEYNASVPSCMPLEVPYSSTGSWDGTNWFGAGLKTLELIGMSKGLSLVGCDLSGINAFFVEVREASGRFLEPFTAEYHWEPPRYSQVAHTGHPASSIARHWASCQSE